ncbi:MAG: hypothetical protein KC503_28635 [Myxococcales bacterium]|nr:hypothetical protein [Myxococcales bacterium]
MDHLIRNEWSRAAGAPCSVAKILDASTHPEGFDVRRLRFEKDGAIALDSRVGHIVSVLDGSGTLTGRTDIEPLALGPGVHVYLPNEEAARLSMRAGSQLVHVAASSPAQERGRRRLVRDEQFLSAMAHGTRSLRWILTPQYLSRRVFLHHDNTLTSKSARHISWFRTTMFDVEGLPPNADGEPVFKMSYNYRTEFNVCFDVEGEARVRFATDPYRDDDAQTWTDWQPLDGDSTYCLHETKARRAKPDAPPQRNKHEVYIRNGYVTLFCMFDPAPTGTESHRPGSYSDYGPLTSYAAILDADEEALESMRFEDVASLEKILRSDGYGEYLELVAPYDRMVDTLSELKARGRLEQAMQTPAWGLYQSGRAAQIEIEQALAERLGADGAARAQVVARWRQQ